jgi:peptide-methionine (R)-S-oxide reductase
MGWPSFSDIIKKGAIKVIDDTSLGMTRQEVVCSKCGSHLGHVFEANDSPSGTHYCINSVALKFNPEK